jgi:hypothetical protein
VRHAGARQHFALDELVQNGGDLQAMRWDTCGHDVNLQLRGESGKKFNTSRRLVPVRVGWVPSSSNGNW